MTSIVDNINSLLTKLPGMMYRCWVDEHWTMAWVTQGAFSLTGYHPEELINNSKISYGELIHSGDQEHVGQAVNRAIEQQRPFSVEYRITDIHGQEKWVWEQGVPVWDEQGKLSHLEGFITDVSEQKREQLKLSQSFANMEVERLENLTLLNQYRNAVDASAMVSKTDARGVITYVNQAFCDNTGFQPEELIGQTHAVIRHPENSDAFYQNLWATIKNNRVWRGTIRNRRRNKEQYLALIHI